MNLIPIVDIGSYYILARLAEKLKCCLDTGFGLAYVSEYLYDPKDGICHENIHAEVIHQELSKGIDLKNAILNLINKV